MDRGASLSDLNSDISYNARALIRCEATYVGASLPTKTTQPPGIIEEPLEKICKKETLPTLSSACRKPVRLYVFHSGILIELLFGKHNGELVWYPIQNLFCTAGLQPFKSKNGNVEFKPLEDKSATKSSLKPLFSMVFRETVHKKVLQCHAFAVSRKRVAQLLVQATAVAYRDKKGWNLPLNSLLFGNSEFSYTLNIADEAHPDSGYSDHEESSQKSSQSPQSSEISAETESTHYQDNQTSQNRNLLIQAFPSTTTLQATSKENGLMSSAYQSPGLNRMPIQKSPASSTTFSDNSADEKSSIRSAKAGSLSSGYPLSRDSSSIAPVMYNPINPQVVLLQRSHSSPDDRQAMVHRSSSHPNSSDFRIASGSQSPISLESFKSLSLKPSSTDLKQKSGSKSRKLKTTTLRSAEDDGIQGRLSSYHNPRGQPVKYHRENHGNFGHQLYHEPVYVPYHPEQFMYEGDRYLPNVVHTDSKSPRSKDRNKQTKETKVVSLIAQY